MGISLPDQIFETIAEAFVDRFICVLGAPKIILTNQERNFISDLMKKAAKIFRIPYNRFSSTIEWIIRKIAPCFGRMFEKQYANSQKQWNK